MEGEVGEREGIKWVIGKGWDELHLLFRVFSLSTNMMPSTLVVAPHLKKT